MEKYYLGISLVICLLLAFSACNLYASATGLNNIPTTDVAPKKTLVLQNWINAAENHVPEYRDGFKYGLIERVEIGIDAKVGSRNAGPVSGQIKYQLQLDSADSKFQSLVGIENISSNSKRLGRTNPYVALSYRSDILRLHMGYNFQDNNEGTFAGIDKTVKFAGRDLTLRSDIKETNRRDHVLGSIGFIYALPQNFLIENWLSIPSDSTEETIFTIKLNYVIKF